jgi:hypothetical protein
VKLGAEFRDGCYGFELWLAVGEVHRKPIDNDVLLAELREALA